MGREFKGRMYTCTCVAESLCCSPETITTLLISYIPKLPGKSHGRRSLVGCSPWGREESDMTE